MPLSLPSEEETQLNISFRDGQPDLKLDVVEIDALLADCWKDKPEDVAFLSHFCFRFTKEFKRKISKTAASILINTKSEVLADIKKKLYLGPEPSDSMESESTPNESSDSSN